MGKHKMPECKTGVLLYTYSLQN